MKAIFINNTIRFSILSMLTIWVVVGCTSVTKTNKTGLSQDGISNDSLLNLVQYQTFQYFWEGADPHSGMAMERIHLDSGASLFEEGVVTSGGSGFGLMAIIVGIERGFISRVEGVARFEKMLDFLESADRFHGAFPHWWNGVTGEVTAFSPKDNGGDLVETAFLMQGLLSVRQYMDSSNEREADVQDRINQLWENVDWSWYTQGKNVLYWHWSPTAGWEMDFPVKGYNECLIMYVLAASSPTHAIAPAVYHEGWAMSGKIKSEKQQLGLDKVLTHYGTDDAEVGPLFWAHYSYLGLNPTHLKDQYADYWKLNVNHATIHYQHCVDNPNDFNGYGENCWGLTSSYSPEGYAGHKPDMDLGVISPTAALSSFPYTPEQSMKFLKYLYAREQQGLVGKYGPYDAFSPDSGWKLERYLAIDQGPIPVMIENYRTGLIWELFMSSPEIQYGLTKLGFSGLEQ